MQKSNFKKILPSKTIDGDESSPILEKLGFTLVPSRYVDYAYLWELPDGWSCPYDKKGNKFHLKDNLGRVRAFGTLTPELLKESAYIHFKCRYQVVEAFNYTNQTSKVGILDNAKNEIIEEIGECQRYIDNSHQWDHLEVLIEMGRAKLKALYPNYQDPTAYWDQ